jgi:hypothetical protein
MEIAQRLSSHTPEYEEASITSPSRSIVVEQGA